MKNEQLLEILRGLGLTDNEAEVYLTSLSLGPTTILKISKASEIRRTTVYSIVESLKKKGLIHVEPAGLKQLYVAESPDRLDNIVEEKKRSLEQLLPQFKALYNLKGKESVIQYYEGLASIKNIYETILKPLKPGDDYLVMSDLQKFFDMDRKYFENYAAKRIKTSIKARLISTDSKQARYMQQYARNMNHEIKILPETYKLSIDMMIVPGRVTIFNLEEPISAISIENQSIVDMQKNMFNLIWSSISK